MKKGLAALRAVLRRMRWDDQGGYCGRHDGKWDFVSTGLPQTSPKELDALFEMAGIVPDEIQSIGDCDTCKFSIDGRERGYIRPCLTCKRPKMSEFKPKAKARRA